jgi:DNA-binding MarR family transcriptional regulator
MIEDATKAADRPVGHHVITGLAKIGLALKSRFWREGERFGLTPTQAQVLGLVRARMPRPIRLSLVAEDLQVTPATASDAVSALVRKGLLTKGRAPDDARAVALRLTSDGEAAADSIAAWPDFLLRAVDTLDEDEQAVFLRGLIKMIRELQERGDIPIARMCVTCRFFRPNVHDDPRAPHHCGLVDAPMGDRHLRIDCLDQEQASPGQQQDAWNRYLRSGVP